ncbi:hypothetical protein BJ166DRAFT_99401 [Pestalotiopsis sp. NC0098]|nr:hypothetical protein BJ166DRAFT_99401 [Pestalotiopsis sp. NC0098]
MRTQASIFFSIFQFVQGSTHKHTALHQKPSSLLLATVQTTPLMTRPRQSPGPYRYNHHHHNHCCYCQYPHTLALPTPSFQHPSTTVTTASVTRSANLFLSPIAPPTLAAPRRR